MPGMRAQDLGNSGSYSTDWLCGPESVTALWTSDSSQTGKLARGTEGRSTWFTREVAAAWGVVLTGLVPTNAHPGVGLARVILSECGHGISLVNVKADLQTPRLLQQPEDRVRNLKKQGLPSSSSFHAMLSLPQIQSSLIQGN